MGWECGIVWHSFRTVGRGGKVGWDGGLASNRRGERRGGGVGVWRSFRTVGEGRRGRL